MLSKGLSMVNMGRLYSNAIAAIAISVSCRLMPFLLSEHDKRQAFIHKPFVNSIISIPSISWPIYCSPFSLFTHCNSLAIIMPITYSRFIARRGNSIGVGFNILLKVN